MPVFWAWMQVCAWAHPVENPYWTYERLEEYYGNMEGYLREYRHYAADDDVNGPVIFLRALIDWGKDFTPKQAGETWLNYTRCGHGMFWWGGEDMSTEHRAYMNLKRGVSAPKSGQHRSQRAGGCRANRRSDLCGYLGPDLSRRSCHGSQAGQKGRLCFP